MNVCFRFLLLLSVVFTINSCSNEIDVLADYEENASVYALLDPNQYWQFVKINKVFVNPNARAKDVAGIADSLYFDTIAPFLIEVQTGKRIPLFKANIALKDSGTFAHSPNYLYVTNEPIDNEYSYRLELVLPSSGKLVSAVTNIVETPFLMLPVSRFSIPPISLTENGNFMVRFQAPKRGKIYDAFLYFNYVEINKNDTTIRQEKTIGWKVMRGYRSLTDKGNETISQNTRSILFYDMLINNIPVDTNVFRRFRPCAFSLISANLELDTYIQASTPSIGIVQKQSEYTNVSNGIGIFASRNTETIYQIQLSDPTKSTIVNTDPYKKLGFVK